MPEGSGRESNGNGERIKWMILSGIVLTLSTGLTSAVTYWYSTDAQQRLGALSANADAERQRLRIEADRARDQLENGIRRELDRIDRAHEAIQHELDMKVDEVTRLEMLSNIRLRLDQIDTRLQRLEDIVFRGQTK